MKVLKRTKKYWTVRMDESEFKILEKAILKDKLDRDRLKADKDYAEWFYENHYEECWHDEYGSWHSCWRRKSDNRVVHDPSFTTRMLRPVKINQPK